MQHDDETALIAATFDALNEGTLARAQRRLDKFIYREPVGGQTKALVDDPLAKQMADDADAESDMWEAWWQSERQDATRALRHLAEHKRLHPEDVDTCTYLVKRGVVLEPTFTQPRRGRVRMEFPPRFKDAATLVAYVLLRLSNRHERVVVCPAHGCGRLLLDDVHVGHPKRFCSTKCRHRFNQQKVRNANRAPAKRK